MFLAANLVRTLLLVKHSQNRALHLRTGQLLVLKVSLARGCKLLLLLMMMMHIVCYIRILRKNLRAVSNELLLSEGRTI